jgi:uncharacterized DUF497 family protein
MSYGFEWDVDKARSNQVKHGVSFDEAATVFEDSLAWIFDDELHSIEEAREIILGRSIKGRLILTCFTERPGNNPNHQLLGCQQRKSKKIMKKPLRKARVNSEEMLPEYNFDYTKAKPNRFSGRINKDRVVVLLDPEVSEVFTTPESVNTVLRALITAMPQGSKRAARRKLELPAKR